MCGSSGVHGLVALPLVGMLPIIGRYGVVSVLCSLHHRFLRRRKPKQFAQWGGSQCEGVDYESEKCDWLPKCPGNKLYEFIINN